MPIYSDYSNAKSVYNQTIEHLNTIRPSTANSVEARIQANRRAISELKRDDAKLSECGKIINEFYKTSPAGGLFSAWNSVFSYQPPETKGLSNTISTEIVKDENKLADRLIQGLYSDHPNYTEILKVMGFLVGERTEFSMEFDKVNKLMNEVSKIEHIQNPNAKLAAMNQIIQNFKPDEKNLLNRRTEDEVENKLALLSFKIQEKLVDKTKIMQEKLKPKAPKDVSAASSSSSSLEEPSSDEIEEAPVDLDKLNRFRNMLGLDQDESSLRDKETTALIENLDFPAVLFGYNITDQSSFKNALKEIKGSPIEKLVSCKKIIEEKNWSAPLGREKAALATEKINTLLESYIKDELKHIDTYLSTVDAQIKNEYVREKKHADSPLISTLLDQVKSLQKSLNLEFQIFKSKKNVPLPEESQRKESQARIKRERIANPHYNEIFLANEELKHKAATLETGLPSSFLRAEKEAENNGNVLFQKDNLFPNSALPITEQMRATLKKNVDYQTWALLTDMQKFSILMLAREPNAQVAAQKIAETLESYPNLK